MCSATGPLIKEISLLSIEDVINKKEHKSRLSIFVAIDLNTNSATSLSVNSNYEMQ